MKILILFLFIGFHISLRAQVEDVKWEDLKINFTEKEPAFVGGTAQMDRFITQNIRSTIPCRARTQVMVQFIVETSGYIVNPKIMKDNGSGCNEEALRVVNLMNESEPRWSSGEQNGRKARMWVNLPIMFNAK
jgi:periplasmic protein TonB